MYIYIVYVNMYRTQNPFNLNISQYLTLQKHTKTPKWCKSRPSPEQIRGPHSVRSCTSHNLSKDKSILYSFWTNWRDSYKVNICKCQVLPKHCDCNSHHQNHFYFLAQDSHAKTFDHCSGGRSSIYLAPRNNRVLLQSNSIFYTRFFLHF